MPTDKSHTEYFFPQNNIDVYAKYYDIDGEDYVIDEVATINIKGNGQYDISVTFTAPTDVYAISFNIYYNIPWSTVRNFVDYHSTNTYWCYVVFFVFIGIIRIIRTFAN